MRASVATEPGRPDGGNEDWAAVSTCGVAVLLDGLSEGPATGCRHGTRWYVRQLGTRLLMLAGDADRPLPEALREALTQVAALHAGSCDLRHPGSPGATVAVTRTQGRDVDYLVLADAVAVVDTGEEPIVVTDERVRAHTPTGRELAAIIEAQQRIRNTEGGYWVAQVDPTAADEALTGTVPDAVGVLLLSDGAALPMTDFEALTWREALEIGYIQGPADLIALTRELEHRDPDMIVWPRLKRHDDATAVVCRW